MAVAEIQSAYIMLEDDLKQKVHFQLMPSSILEMKNVDWTDITVIGRSEPIRVYAGSGARIFSFSLMFVASVDQDDGGTSKGVVKKVNFLQSLTYPEVKEGITLHPPVVFLVVGHLFNSRCIVRTCQTRWLGPWDLWVEGDPSKGKLGWKLSHLFKPTLGYGLGELLGLNTHASEKRADPYLPQVAEVNLTMEEVNITPHTSRDVRKGRDPALDLGSLYPHEP